MIRARTFACLAWADHRSGPSRNLPSPGGVPAAGLRPPSAVRA